MTEIKICGITNIEDALNAAESGVDALGFIFHPASPRFVTPQQAREIIQELPSEISRVGVFVNRDIREVQWTADFCRLDFLQLHGNETPEYCRNFPAHMIFKAVFPSEETDIKMLSSYPVKALIADSRDAGRYGGTGKKTDWAAAKKVAGIMPLILAGGLDAEIIEAAIEAVSPCAVDVCSGVEAWPGKKDHEKVKDVIASVRALKKNGGTKIFSKKNDSLHEKN